MASVPPENNKTLEYATRNDLLALDDRTRFMASLRKKSCKEPISGHANLAEMGSTACRTSGSLKGLHLNSWPLNGLLGHCGSVVVAGERL